MFFVLPHQAHAESTNNIFSNDNLTISGQNISIVVNANHNSKDIANTTATMMNHSAPTPFDITNNSATTTTNNDTTESSGVVNQSSSSSMPTMMSSSSSKIQTNPFEKLGQQVKAMFANMTTGKSKLNMTLPSTTSVPSLSHIEQVVQYDKAKNCAIDQHDPTNVLTYLTHFSCGHVTTFDNGTTLRKFTLVVEENHKIPITEPPKAIMFPGWTFNGSIPGPTLRMTEGDHVQVTLVNKGTMSHTLHMHSIHPGNMDGVPGLSGASGNVEPGKSFTYDFIARPFGVYPYHCHASPIVEHINRGLYGVMIIDPKHPRAPAHEMVMLLNGYSLNVTAKGPRMPTQAEANALTGIIPAKETIELPAELDNDIYSVNGVAFYYYDHPIQMKVNQSQRIYLVNMLDFEENSYHMHGNMYNYITAGTTIEPDYKTDMVTLGQGDRGIMEFTYKYPGKYMQHAHFDQIAGRGWMSVLEVK